MNVGVFFEMPFADTENCRMIWKGRKKKKEID